MNEAKYNVVRKFVREYANATGRTYEIVYEGKVFEDAERLAAGLNVSAMDDYTDVYVVRPAHMGTKSI
jgi:hypothetical protein